MAHASKKHLGPAARGKHDGSGAWADIRKEKIGDNMVLTNRDKSRHSHERGQDSKGVQTDQLQDHAANRMVDE